MADVLQKIHWILGGIILKKTKSVPFNGTQEQEAMLRVLAADNQSGLT